LPSSSLCRANVHAEKVRVIKCYSQNLNKKIKTILGASCESLLFSCAFCFDFKIPKQKAAAAAIKVISVNTRISDPSPTPFPLLPLGNSTKFPSSLYAPESQAQSACSPYPSTTTTKRHLYSKPRQFSANVKCNSVRQRKKREKNGNG
jgi:hypothetical protein